jgi:predicted transcriptional regulator
LVQHHLRQLERAGLIDYMDDPEVPGKTKLAYPAAKVRVQIQREPKPTQIEPIAAELLETEVWEKLGRKRVQE